jgi:hypothetical protein
VKEKEEGFLGVATGVERTAELPLAVVVPCPAFESVFEDVSGSVDELLVSLGDALGYWGEGLRRGRRGRVGAAVGDDVGAARGDDVGAAVDDDVGAAKGGNVGACKGAFGASVGAVGAWGPLERVVGDTVGEGVPGGAAMEHGCDGGWCRANGVGARAVGAGAVGVVVTEELAV